MDIEDHKDKECRKELMDQLQHGDFISLPTITAVFKHIDEYQCQKEVGYLYNVIKRRGPFNVEVFQSLIKKISQDCNTEKSSSWTPTKFLLGLPEYLKASEYDAALRNYTLYFTDFYTKVP